MPLFRLTDHLLFPPVHLAEEGLLAVGGDLSPERLLAAYRSGIFPWYSEDDPILWWAPERRMVLFPEALHVSRRFKRTLDSGHFTATADAGFDDVIKHCASVPRRGQDGTWILPEMIEAYTRLHHQGYVHSIECRVKDELVGGLYGLSLGGCFFGESMFSLVKDASKVAFTALANQCRQWGFLMIDCQLPTAHLYGLGACDISREKFMGLLKNALHMPTRKGPWRLDETVLTSSHANTRK